MESLMVSGVVIGAVVLVGLLLLAVVVVGAVLMFRGKKVDPAVQRAEALAGLGFTPLKAGTWIKPIQGSKMTFEDRPDGFRWQMQLPRYNTMTLELVESGSPEPVTGQFETEIAAIDARFRVGSPQAARVVTLLGQPKLQRALLATPNIAMSLSADELIILDPGRAGLKQLNPGTPLDAELALHTLTMNVVNSLFAVLYTEDGTVMEAFR
ncbi:MAG: hypothetical protein R3F61_22645 [Myxococcota bacterium]